MIPKKDFCHLGFVSDASQRISQICLYFHNQVAAAHNAIYKLGAPIKGAFPESQLKDFSLVPTFVCYSLLVSASIDHTFVTRTHSLIYLDPLDSTSITCLQLIYYMSLSHIMHLHFPVQHRLTKLTIGRAPRPAWMGPSYSTSPCHTGGLVAGCFTVPYWWLREISTKEY